MRWEDWERTSTRDAQPRKMMLGGMVGSVVLLTGSLVHVGKVCVFGHGEYGVAKL